MQQIKVTTVYFNFQFFSLSLRSHLMYLPVPVPRLHAVVLHLLPPHLKITHHQRAKHLVSLIMTLTLVYCMSRNLASQKTALITFLWIVLSVSWVLLPSCFPGFLHFPESVSRRSIDFFTFFTFSFFLLETHYHLHIARLTPSSNIYSRLSKSIIAVQMIVSCFVALMSKKQGVLCVEVSGS